MLLTKSIFFAILTVLIVLIQLKLEEVILLIQINYRDPRPIYEQVKDGFRKLIFTGILRPDERMPSVRELATSLAINPNTIQRAYRELEQEGYICSVPGKGSFVTDASSAAVAHRQDLLQQLRQISTELRQLGTDDETIIAWIQGGPEHDSSH